MWGEPQYDLIYIPYEAVRGFKDLNDSLILKLDLWDSQSGFLKMSLEEMFLS